MAYRSTFLEEMRDKLQSLIDDKKSELGEIPPDTCPHINKAQQIIEDVAYDAKGVKKHRDIEDIDEANSLIDELIEQLHEMSDKLYDVSRSELEDLRSDNEKLRELGREWYLFASQLLE